MQQEHVDTVQAFVERFTKIGHERIEGMPIYNTHLHVEAIDFTTDEQGLIGVLITPWFINIMLLPHDSADLQGCELGSKHLCKAGETEQKFVLGEEDELGHYLFKTVISPTHCLKDQAAARAEARKALQTLRGELEEYAVENPVQAKFSDDIQKGMGRRDFFRKLTPTT